MYRYLIITLVFFASKSSFAQTINQGLIAHYCFNGNAIDNTGSKHGTLMNGASATTDRHGNTSSALRLDGIDDFIQLPSDTWINGDFSFSGWVKLAANGSWPHLWGFGNGTNKQNVFFSTDNGSNGLSHFTTHECISGNSYDRIITPTAFPTNTWTHIVITLSGNQVNIYKNQTLWQTGTTSILPCTGVKDSAFIGKSNFTFNNNSTINGDLDDFRFYNRVLSAQEINELFNLSSTLCAPQSVDEKTSVHNKLTLAPNPTQNNSFEILNLDQYSNSRVSIFDMYGKKMDCTQKGNKFLLKNEAVKGIYTVKLTSDKGFSISHKLIVY